MPAALTDDSLAVAGIPDVLAAAAAPATVKQAVQAWFASRGWTAFAFQKSVWAAIGRGESGLLHATTGSGKTYAVWLAALLAFTPRAGSAKKPTSSTKKAATGRFAALPLTVLWITPMRALAADSVRALQSAVDGLAATGYAGSAAWTVGARTGDTSSSERSAQSRRLPSALVTTPESLSLLLARSDAAALLESVQLVLVDEWHELVGSKRGVQVQLAIARLRGWRRGAAKSTTHKKTLCVWGMSATLGNLDEAMATLLGPSGTSNITGTLVQGAIAKTLQIDTLLPLGAHRSQRFPWAGQLGQALLPQVVQAIESASTTLIFTNTRAQAEVWFGALLDARPDWAGILALHHGSLDRSVREWVEGALKTGALKAVVCTSSLDLGVDFLPVERVLQIGSPKGVARLLQRAGRSGHAPGRPSRITLVPTHSLELVEAAAVRAAVAAGQIEPRFAPEQPLDVLVQHLVTVALGGGFQADALYLEVRQTAAYQHLSPDAWQWCLDFVQRGGPSLALDPDYQRAVPDSTGRWQVPDARLALRHRQNIGTITSNASMAVQFLRGARLGTVEENFVARLRPGDCFLFAGRTLELVRIHQMTAFVKPASSRRAAIPRWGGSRVPMSGALSQAMLEQLKSANAGVFASPEMQAAQPLLALQQHWSAIPTPDFLLAEVLHSREGWHLFLYPFAGRLVHTGLASLMAWRAASNLPATISMAANDYGLELLSSTEIDWAARLPALIAPAESPAALLAEVVASLNAGEMARRRFRDIARVSGLVFEGPPSSQRKSSRQLQASSQLFYDVFRKYDPANRLLQQADQELLRDELDIVRLEGLLARLATLRLHTVPLLRATPFAFPLLVERLREQLSSESAADRIARMVRQLEAAAGLVVGDLKTAGLGETAVPAPSGYALGSDLFGLHTGPENLAVERKAEQAKILKEKRPLQAVKPKAVRRGKT